MPGGSMAKSLFREVRKRNVLWQAWSVIQQNGLQSRSEDTRIEIQNFGAHARKNIYSLQRQLADPDYKFQPAVGIAAKKPGKSSKRPIVISAIGDRVVQRAILDVLQSHKPIQKYLDVLTSYGGIQGRGQPDALRALYQKIDAAAEYYLRSDIESFFTRIPKPTIVETVAGLIEDKEFVALFQKAITTELSNLEALGADKDLFPIHEIGVAQGSCLSPLIGNILLSEFDTELNGGNVTCLRYIDDFIIVGPSREAVRKAFKKARALLKQHGLTAYDPKTDPSKAQEGPVKKGLTFLGCDIRPGMIRPNKGAYTRLLISIDTLFQSSMNAMHDPNLLRYKRQSLSETLYAANNIIRGWGNQYSFCNDTHLLDQLDVQLDDAIKKYIGRYDAQRKKKETSSAQDRRRLLGVHLLADSKSDPIVDSVAKNEKSKPSAA
jgi:retron-type reverse transcriptase